MGLKWLGFFAGNHHKSGARIGRILEQGRDYVGPEDIQAVASDVLRHRLVMSFEAEADGITADSVIKGVLDGVGVP